MAQHPYRAGHLTGRQPTEPTEALGPLGPLGPLPARFSGRDAFAGLLGGIPLTLLGGLGAVWLDHSRAVDPLLAHAGYPVAVGVGGLLSVGWTRLVAGDRGTADLEVAVVLVSLIATLVALSALVMVPLLVA